jgi:hypothetical protein
VVRRFPGALLGAALSLSPITASAKRAAPPPSTLLLYMTESEAIRGCHGDEVACLNTRTGIYHEKVCVGMGARSKVPMSVELPLTALATATRVMGSSRCRHLTTAVFSAGLVRGGCWRELFDRPMPGSSILTPVVMTRRTTPCVSGFAGCDS